MCFRYAGFVHVLQPHFSVVIGLLLARARIWAFGSCLARTVIPRGGRVSHISFNFKLLMRQLLFTSIWTGQEGVIIRQPVLFTCWAGDDQAQINVLHDNVCDFYGKGSLANV